MYHPLQRFVAFEFQSTGVLAPVSLGHPTPLEGEVVVVLLQSWEFFITLQERLPGWRGPQGKELLRLPRGEARGSVRGETPVGSLGVFGLKLFQGHVRRD